MVLDQITDTEDGVSTITDATSGTEFKTAIKPATAVEEILSLELDSDNDVFNIQEINVGNQEFTMVFGRTQTY